MSRPVAKITVTCSQCGNTQAEPAQVKSTYCRQCSAYIAVLAEVRDEKTKSPLREVSEAKEGIFEKARNLFSSPKSKVIRCFECKTPQEVSSSATSTLCPSCGAYIDLTDFRIQSAHTRNIRTRGTIHVLPKGDLGCTKAECSSAVIEGRLRAHLDCDGEVILNCKGKITGGIDGLSLIVEKRADVECSRPVRMQQVEIRGNIKGHIECEGVAVITKSGVVRGSLMASGIRVEKGGIFEGELQITPRKPLREQGDAEEVSEGSVVETESEPAGGEDVALQWSPA